MNSQDLQLKLQKIKDFCLDTCKNLKSESKSTCTSFDYTKFMNDLILRTKILDESVTKFAVLCKAPPKIPESIELADSLLSQAKALSSCIQSVNESIAGHYFWQRLKDASEAVFSCLAEVADSFSQVQLHQRQEQVIRTRKLWDSCKQLQSIPKNDAFAVGLMLKNSLELIDDALSEVASSTEELSTDSTCNLVHADFEFIRLASELIQGCFAFLKKSIVHCVEQETCISCEAIRWLDLYGREAMKCQILTDVICCALFHPLDKNAVCDASRKLVGTMDNLIGILKQELPDEKTCWIVKYPAFFSNKLSEICERHPER